MKNDKPGKLLMTFSIASALLLLLTLIEIVTKPNGLLFMDWPINMILVILIVHYSFYTMFFYSNRIQPRDGWFKRVLESWGYVMVGLPVMTILVLLTINTLDQAPPPKAHLLFGNIEMQDNYKQWLKQSRQISPSRPGENTPDTNRIIIDFLSSHSIGIPEDYSDSFNTMEIPRYINALDAVRYLAQSKNTDWDNRKSTTILKMAYNLSPDTGVPTLIQTLVAMAISAIYTDSYSAIIENADEDELHRSMALLDMYERGIRHSLATSLMAEYAFGSDFFERLAMKEMSPTFHMTIKINETRQVWYDYMNSLSELACRSLYEVEKDLDEIRNAAERYYDLESIFIVNNPTGKILMKAALPKLGSTILKLNDAIARIRLSKIAIAITLYKRDRGTWPETLGDLSPKYISDIPVDPRTGKGFIYSKVKKEIHSEYERKYDKHSKAMIKI